MNITVPCQSNMGRVFLSNLLEVDKSVTLTISESVQRVLLLTAHIHYTEHATLLNPYR